MDVEAACPLVDPLGTELVGIAEFGEGEELVSGRAPVVMLYVVPPAVKCMPSLLTTML